MCTLLSVYSCAHNGSHRPRFEGAPHQKRESKGLHIKCYPSGACCTSRRLARGVALGLCPADEPHTAQEVSGQYWRSSWACPERRGAGGLTIFVPEAVLQTTSHRHMEWGLQVTCSSLLVRPCPERRASCCTAACRRQLRPAAHVQTTSSPPSSSRSSSFWWWAGCLASTTA